jgi:protein required for attachment to host cells
MTTSWVVVANRVGARFFEHRGPGKPLVLRESVDHPQGRFQDRDVGTDRPGRSGESGSTSRHAMEPHETAHEHDAHVFAKDLARRLSKARAEHAFGRLVLVAEHHFLGYLERELDKPTDALVTDRVHKDLANVADRDVGSHLGGVLPIG